MIDIDESNDMSIMRSLLAHIFFSELVMPEEVN